METGTRKRPTLIRNIVIWTRRAFGLEQVELREFEAEAATEALDLNANRPTLDNIRLWDWHALQDTLKQIQAIRTYYDFPDVDVDLLFLGRLASDQMMVAAREINVGQTTEASRSGSMKKLIYTHGYGITTGHGKRLHARRHAALRRSTTCRSNQFSRS